MYKQAQAQQGAAGQTAEQAAPGREEAPKSEDPGSGAVDADFEVVDDDKK